MAAQQESVFTGKTLDDAVRMGLSALGLSRAEVIITVLEEGSSGFLGIGVRPYRVRVMPRPGGPPREPGEREERRRPRGRRERAPRGEGRAEPVRVGRAAGGERTRERREPTRSAEARRAEGGRAGAELGPEGGRRRRRRRGGGGRGRGGEHRMPAEPGGFPMTPESAPARGGSGREVRAETPAPSGASERPGREEPGREVASRAGGRALAGPELEARALGLTEDLLRAMGFEARVSARAEGDRVEVTAEVSEDEELLTGRKGEVRQALQHLLNLALNRGQGMRHHLQLEINDFWHRREEELTALARAMADQAVARGGEVLTEYLNAQERRVIHVTLRDDPRVKSYAIGDGLIKKLAVAPADRPEVSRTAG